MESYFDGIDNVFVHFDDKDGLYEGGQALSGTIKILVKSATRIKEVKLYIQGRVRIKWIEVENGSNVPYEEIDFPLNDVVLIHSANKGTARTFVTNKSEIGLVCLCLNVGNCSSWG